jgi:hypothetical protein
MGFNNVTVIYHRYKVEGLDHLPFSGRMAQVGMKQEGKWQIIGGMGTKE